MDIIAGPVWGFGIYAVLLLAAAIQDGATNKISNLLVIGLFIAAIATAVVQGIEIDIWQNVAVAFGVLVVGSFLFARGWLGGGDVKLLAATAFWFAVSDVPMLLLSIVLGGVALVLVWIPIKMARGRRSGAGGLSVLKERSLPYGIAIALGGIYWGYEVHTRLPDMFDLGATFGGA